MENILSKRKLETFFEKMDCIILTNRSITRDNLKNYLQEIFQELNCSDIEKKELNETSKLIFTNLTPSYNFRSVKFGVQFPSNCFTNIMKSCKDFDTARILELLKLIFALWNTVPSKEYAICVIFLIAEFTGENSSSRKLLNDYEFLLKEIHLFNSFQKEQILAMLNDFCRFGTYTRKAFFDMLNSLAVV